MKLDKAFRFKAWADERTLEAIESIDGVQFPETYAFALQQLNHMVIVEELFRLRLEGKPETHNSTNTDEVPVYAELRQRIALSNQWMMAFLANCQELSRTVSFHFTDGNPGRLTAEEILFHLLSHGSYHRGNIARALDLAGVSHPIDGYPTYIHATEPHRRGL